MKYGVCYQYHQPMPTLMNFLSPRINSRTCTNDVKNNGNVGKNHSVWWIHAVITQHRSIALPLDKPGCVLMAQSYRHAGWQAQI